MTGVGRAGSGAQGIMYTYGLGVDALERKAAENFALYFRRRQVAAPRG